MVFYPALLRRILVTMKMPHGSECMRFFSILTLAESFPQNMEALASWAWASRAYDYLGLELLSLQSSFSMGVYRALGLLSVGFSF